AAHGGCQARGGAAVGARRGGGRGGGGLLRLAPARCGGGERGGGVLVGMGAHPPLPPVEECTGFADFAGATRRAGYAGQVDLRLDPATSGWLRGEPHGVPEMRGYFQLREERLPDAYLLALAVDALPPVIFGITRAGWSPTVELTWHMRALPAP